jgi:hypothetical protein
MMDKVSLCQLGHIEEGDPEELGRMMGDLARRYPDIDIWGGCCGTWDKHFDRIAHYVGEARREVVPSQVRADTSRAIVARAAGRPGED